MEWFKHWFNSKEYLNVYQHRDKEDARELLQLVLNNIDTENVRTVLDMAAGYGRHAEILSKKGFDVTAVDLSEMLLNIARNNAEEENLNIEFIRSDIRKFNPDKKFDLIINLFTSIGYFDEDEENFKVLNKAYNLLAENGYFILDYMNKNFVRNTLVPLSVDETDNGTIIQNRYIKGERIIKEIIIEREGKQNKYYESVRMFSYDELISIMQKIGFRVLKTFGDFLGNPFELETSPRIIIISHK
ncbi:class I SAM-dependent methyltransferase [bacterium BMS3Abin03]|nr:class I SAM-dependent methyltransferase [bacterium BMS3Abin03]MCG6959315.1 class I SAM-dependent methyltransferase [bacterium BMS3Abin03]